MITIEEYIARRKKEDKVNEFDINVRIENIRTYVNYIFEYFNNYLNISEAEEKTALRDEKLDKYRRQLKDYKHNVINSETLLQIFNKIAEEEDL